jgi:hypothetical protein
VFEAVATDAAGNADPSPATRTFTVDATPPTVTITKRPKKTIRTTRSTVKVAFSFTSEPGATYRCTLDGKALTCGTSAKASAKASVKPGKHTFTVTAVDAAGNRSTPQVVSFKVLKVNRPH